MSPNRPLVGKRSLPRVSDNHPDNGNPPRTSARCSRLDRGQPIAREPVQPCVRKAMGQHLGDGAAMW
jgi:hypothetical protein